MAGHDERPQELHAILDRFGQHLADISYGLNVGLAERIAGQLDALDKRLTRLEASKDMLREAILELCTDVREVRDRIGVLEDLEARAADLVGNNSPPPVAEPKPKNAAPPVAPGRKAA